MENKIKFVAILLIGIAIILSAVIILQLNPKQDNPDFTEQIRKFNSSEELKNFVRATQNNEYSYFESVKKTGLGATPVAESSASMANEYSTTNIQVEGVDEADIVKNDGKYIYAVSGNQVFIIDAYPAENMRILSKINLTNRISDIYLNENKLVVFSSHYSYDYTDYMSIVYTYNIRDIEKPVLESNFSIEGEYIDSRMIGEYVYVISQKQINIEMPEPPVYILNGIEKQISTNEVYYFDYEDNRYVFTAITAININKNKADVKTYLTGYSSIIYVSQNNIYLTHTKTMPYKDYVINYIKEVVVSLIPENEQIKSLIDSDKNEWQKMSEISQLVYKYSNSLKGEEKEKFDDMLMNKTNEFQLKIAKESDKTAIYKIKIDKEKIEHLAGGEVPGKVLNQFSMDEFEGKFRIATTTGVRSVESLNHLYVLDEELNIFGNVEDLAKGEKIYSARFMGKRAYIVTFKKVDPLFVIDLSNPKNPKVLGYLKITGYSDYLHSYDENHIIGVGKETRGGNEHFSWYQGIKLSLFDVSDVENPKEVGKIEIGDRGTESYALSEHKAFLFDKKRNLLVIPISLAEINKSRYSESNIPDNAYGEHVWQGAYVLNIDLNGISLRGKITHENETSKSRWYSPNQIQRSLYIDNILYTISQAKIKANALDTIEEIKSLDLPPIQITNKY